MPERPQQLAHLEALSDATQFADRMHALIPKCALLENFSGAEVRLLGFGCRPTIAHDLGTPVRMRCQHPVVEDEVDLGPWRQRRQCQYGVPTLVALESPAAN